MNIGQTGVPQPICPGDDLNLIAQLRPSNATSGGSNFFWEAGEGNTTFFTSTTGPGVTIPIPDPIANFHIWVRVTFTSPCDGSQVTQVILVPLDVFCLEDNSGSNGIGQVAKPQLLGEPKVFPNPFGNSTELRFEANTDAQAQLNVFNVTGQAIHSQTVRVLKGQNTVELNRLPNDQKGLLYYHLSVGNEILSTGKMIRQ